MTETESVEEHLRDRATREAAAIAVRFKARTVTFAELRDALDSVAERVGPVGGVRALAVLPEGLGAYLLHLHFFIGLGTLAPQSPATSRDRLATVISHFRPALLITTPALFRKYDGLDFECPVLLVHEDSSDTGDISWEWSGGTPDPAGESENDVRVVLFTAGSTGVAKGVCLGSRALEAAARMNVGILSLGPGRRSLATVPLYDYYGLIQIYSHLLSGGELVLGETPAFPASVLRQIENAGATDLVGVPFGLRRIFRAAEDIDTRALRRLRVVTSSSETLSPELVQLIFRRSPNATVFDIYGLTEAGRACSHAIRRGEEASRSIGRPSPGVTITGGRSPQEPDELVIQGPNVMLGYLSGISPDGQPLYERCDTVRTGDLGYVDAEGNVTLTGRRDHLLNVRGDKVHPSEIEAVALEWPGVSDARVHLESGAEPELVLEVVTGDVDPGFEPLRRLLRDRLPFHLVPRRIVRVQAIARTELGSKTVRT